MNRIIITKNLSKKFGNNKIILPCDLEFKKNKITVISGPSGSGKSTLLYLLSGLLTPNTGQVLINAQNLYELSATKRAQFIGQNIGFVFQNFQLLADFTILENILIAARFNQNIKKTILQKKVLTWLEDFQLTKRKNAFPSEISGGESQRVAIIRSLINQPKLLFCDEPTGNLDSQQAQKLITLLKNLQTTLNLTIIIVTHDERLKAIADQKFNITDGVIKLF